MAAAFVVMGAVACSEGFVNPFDKGNGNEGGNGGGGNTPQTETYAFYAEITDVVAPEGASGEVCQPEWLGGEKLVVTTGGKSYTFVNSTTELGRFVSEDEGAESIKGATKVIIKSLHANGNTVDSYAGKAGFSLYGAYESFPGDNKVILDVQSSYIHYSSKHTVTLAATTTKAIFSVKDSNSVSYASSITLPAGDDVWVPFVIRDNETMTLVAAVDGELAFETTEPIALAEGMVYDIGEIISTAAPEYKIYLHKHNNAWESVNLYSWDSNEVTYTGEWPGTPTTATETINGYEYLVWTMPLEAIGKEMNIIANDGTNQTADFALGVLDKSYYVLLSGKKLSIIADLNNPEPAPGETPEPAGNMVYFSAKHWESDGAWFAIYCWSTSGNGWSRLEDNDGDGIHEGTLPEGFEPGCGALFCRMNPAYNECAWNGDTVKDRVWNQTTDTIVPTDGNNLFTVKDGEWDGATGTWSKK